MDPRTTSRSHSSASPRDRLETERIDEAEISRRYGIEEFDVGTRSGLPWFNNHGCNAHSNDVPSEDLSEAVPAFEQPLPAGVQIQGPAWPRLDTGRFGRVSRAARLIAIVVGVPVVLAIAGVPGTAAPVVLPFVLATLLWFALTAGSPWRGSREPRDKWERPSSLASYRVFTEASIPGALLAGAAYAEAADALGGGSLALVVCLIAFGVYMVGRRVGDAVSGVVGLLAAIWLFLFERGACSVELAAASVVMFVVVIAFGLAGASLLRAPASVGVGSFLPDRVAMWFTRPVPLGNSVVPAHAAFLYSCMRPSHRLVRSTVTVAGGASGWLSTGVGGRCLSDWCGRC